MTEPLDRARYRSLIQARLSDPASLQRALAERPRRDVHGRDGRLLLLAADHTARGMLAVAGNPLAVADRFGLLQRLVAGLATDGVDGVLASADILEELAWLGALDGRLAIGTMNRGGVIGASWELDDRMSAYDAAHVESCGLDGGKTLLRIDMHDPGVARTLESVAAAATQLNDRRLLCMIEPLPYTQNEAGRAVLDQSVERLIQVVSVASGLGSSSAYTWLKVPVVARMPEVAAATTLPMLMLGGDPGSRAAETFALWDSAMREPNVRGLVAGRTLLYPQGETTDEAIGRAVSMVHGGLPR